MVNFKIKKCARIVALGDSYTEHGWWHLEAMHEMNKYSPDTRIKFLNCGIGGDTMHGAKRRLNWDTAPLVPTHLFILFGMNDSKYPDYRRNIDYSEAVEKRAEVFKIYENSLLEIIDHSLSENWQPVLGTPTPLPNSNESTYNVEAVNEVLNGFSKIIREVAKKEQLPLVDLNRKMSEVYKSWQGNADVDLFADDHIHPNIYGYRIIGRLFANEMGINTQVPKSLKEAEFLFEDFDNAEMQRYKIEKLLRSCAFFRKQICDNGFSAEPEEAQLDYAFKIYNNPETVEWRREVIKNWIIWHNRTEELLGRLERVLQVITD